MGKDPIITRSELRRLREEEEKKNSFFAKTKKKVKSSDGFFRKTEENPAAKPQSGLRKTSEVKQQPLPSRQSKSTTNPVNTAPPKKEVKQAPKQNKAVQHPESRTEENEKIRERNHVLNVLIVLVALLLVGLIYLVITW